MFSKTTRTTQTFWAFPRNRFVDYELSDLEWAVPLGFAKKSLEYNLRHENDKLVDFKSSQSQSIRDEQVVIQESSSSSVVYNPNSNWKPVWNPILISE